MSGEFILIPQSICLGPWPVNDNQGFQTAIKMLRASQKERRNDKAYLQFDYIRKIRSGYSTVNKNSANGGARLLCLKGDQYKTLVMNNGSTRKFMLGLERRMGSLVKQDMGISVEVLVTILNNYELEMFESGTTKGVEFEIW